VDVVDDLYYWTNHLLIWGEMALWAWAIVDCGTRRAAAFPAADKLTKPAWLTILVLGALFGYLTTQPFRDGDTNPVGIIALIATVASAIYLADVRPTIREITDRR
jgi:hypothetical protein